MYGTTSLGFITDLISVSVSIIVGFCTLPMSINWCSNIKCDLAVTGAHRRRAAYDIVNQLPCRVFWSVCGGWDFSVRVT